MHGPRVTAYGKHETYSHAFVPLFDCDMLVRRRTHLQNPSGETIQFRPFIRKSNVPIGTKLYCQYT
jgi:hypothetical protein